ncbi:MAG: glycoside hydrolase family 13 protein [Clostridia bacterium]|nr:glycoside hydrolase family 13 protein [Clostridia bacterium]
MDFIPYNSSYTYHKFPFGAVTQGTEITFRIILPKSFGCNSAVLRIRRDGEYSDNIPMQWERNEGYGEEWWKVTFTPGDTGLYFYRFCIFNSYSENFITRSSGSIGLISCEGDDFFFTVYDKDFRTPDKIKGSVIYQIFPDRFCYSGEEKSADFGERILRDDWGAKPRWSPGKDGRITKYDFFRGDFKGIESKLGYLKSLGVGCIYLNPIFLAESNHRYDTADYEVPDPLLGTEEDFSRLCKKAKENGIDIILDGVFSHTGANSKYFNKDGTFGDGGAYNDKNSPYYPWYKFSEYPDKYDCWWGIDILPEVDETNDSYIEYIRGILRKWQGLGASGWRLDVADELPDKFLDALREEVKSNDSEALIIGEVWEDASCKISYGERRRYLQGRQLDSVMNYPFADALVWFAVSGVAERFNDRINEICENYPKCVLDCLMNHIGTHDTCRILNRLGTLEGYSAEYGEKRYNGEMTEEETARGKRLLKFVSSMQFTLPGVPCIYYGDEAGAIGGVDPYNRGCYPYGNEDEDLLAHYRFLGKLRKEHPVFKDGSFVPVSSCLGCVAYERQGRGERIITVANRNPHPIVYTLPCEGFEILTGEEVKGRDLYLDGVSAAILVKSSD